MPDLNSLPPSRSPSAAFAASPLSQPLRSSMPSDTARSSSPSPSPRGPSSSLQAAAAMNAGLQQEEMIRRRSSNSSLLMGQTPGASQRRRASVLHSIHANDPTQPAPGEMAQESFSPLRSPHSMSASPILAGFTGDPHHGRHASLGSLHQELEQEQEGQVNRLLATIRQQRDMIEQLQVTQGVIPTAATSSAVDESIPAGPRRTPSFRDGLPLATSSQARSPGVNFSRTSFDAARVESIRRSRTPSRTASPRIRRSSAASMDPTDPFSISTPSRDESALFQAEMQMITRENQMLRQRIRELERQVSELNVNSSITREPARPSNLIRTESADDQASESSPTMSPPGSFPA